MEELFEVMKTLDITKEDIMYSIYKEAKETMRACVDCAYNSEFKALASEYFRARSICFAMAKMLYYIHN